MNGLSSCIKKLSQGLPYATKVAALCLTLMAVNARSQNPTDSINDPDLRTLVLELRTELRETRQRLADAELRIEKLSRSVSELHGDRGEFVQQTNAYPSATDTTQNASALPQASGSMEESLSLVRSQLSEHQQTKVESASKYRVKLSGLILMNAFSNRGGPDLADLPNRALRSGPGSIGATLRQSIVGVQVIGPSIANGRSSASVSMDFAGGFAQRPYGTTMGLFRLRQASGRIDWENTSVVFGQETPVVSPLSPTTYATLAEPGFSWAGNLWVWTPQALVERKFRSSDNSYFSLTGGLAAPMTEDIPSSAQFVAPNAGELSRRPAVELVASWHSSHRGQPLVVGAGGYVGSQKYSFGRSTDSWAGTAFWDLPLLPFLSWSGEAYRGQATGGLGGGVWQSVTFNGNPTSPDTLIRPLNSIGGWTQLKFRVQPKLEFNVAAGQDNVLSSDLRWAPQITGEYSSVFARNRVGFLNTVYRPKSNLLFSVEYRKLWTWRHIGDVNRADQVNVAAGVSF